MADLELFFFELAALAVLVSYLFIKLHQRARKWAPPRDPAHWTGKAIDVTELIPAVEDARRSGWLPRQPAMGRSFRKALLGLMRRHVTRLGYFHDRNSEEHLQV
jgi:hypothetical protein